MTVLRAVLDTNVVVSALVFAAGSVSWLRYAWQQGRLVPVVDRTTTAELLRVLADPKFDLTAAERDDLLAEFLPWCETFGRTGEAVDLSGCRDPQDLPFLRLALAARVDGLVTGDHDLLALRDRVAIPILTPTEMTVRLGEAEPPRDGGLTLGFISRRRHDRTPCQPIR